MAHIARKQIRERGDNGDVFAVIALVLGYPVFAVLLVALPCGVVMLMGALLDGAFGHAPILIAGFVAVWIAVFATEMYFYVRWVRGLGRPEVPASR